MRAAATPLIGLDELTTTEARELARIFQFQRFRTDSVLFTEQEKSPAFYIIKSGKVELVRRDSSGETRMVDVLVQGDFFGEMALLAGKGWMATARVVEDAELSFVARSDFEKLTYERPALAVKILTFVAHKLEQPERLDAFTYDRRDIHANRIIAIAGAGSGSGRTFLSTNLARALADRGHANETALSSSATPEPCGVALLELDCPFGNAALHLGCKVERSWLDLLDAFQNGQELRVEDYAVEAAPGVYFFAGPSDNDRVLDLAEADVIGLLELLKRRFERIVIDLPVGLSTLGRVAAGYADKVLVVSTYTIDAVARTRRLLGAFASFPGYPEKFPVVINRQGSSLDIGLEESESLRAPILMRLANNRRVQDTLRQGGLWYDRHPRATLTHAFRELASLLVGADDRLGDDATFLAHWLPFRDSSWGWTSTPWDNPAALAGRSLFRRRRGRARLAHGEARFLEGNHFRAFQELRRAVDDDPTLARAYLLLGEISLILGRRRESLTYFEAALRADPSGLKALTHYAVLQRGTELIVSCRRRLEAAVENKPTWADLRVMLGMVCTVAGDYRSAIESYTEALRLNPRYAEAFRGLGDLYVQQRKNTQALEFYLKAIGANEGDIPARYGLARVYRSLGITALACRSYREVIERCPHHSPAQQELLRLHEELALLDDEISNYELALEIHPEFSDTLHRLAEAYTRRGRFDVAIRCFKRALRFNPDLLAAKEGLLRVRAIKERLERGGQCEE